MPVYLMGYARCMLYSDQPTVLLARRLLNEIHLTNFENLNFISNLFQETHNFLVLTDPVIICIYLRNTNIHFHDQGNACLSTSKLLKRGLVQILNTFWNPSLQTFAARMASIFSETNSDNCQWKNNLKSISDSFWILKTFYQIYLFKSSLNKTG